MTESTPASILDGLVFEAVEWLPSGGESGLVRVRGRWSPGVARPEGLPVLCASVGGGVSRYESLPDAQRDGNGSLWRGAYLVPEAIARSGVWLEWESGERSALPVPAGLDERAAPVSDEPVAEDEAGGELIDRSVLAERRARRAEAAEQAQARAASEALRALDALERRGTELEARVEELVAERDALATRAAELEKRAPREEHQRAALADALASAAATRRRARDLQLHLQTSEIARTSDAVRLRVLEAREADAAPLRAERAALDESLAAARERATALEVEAARAREQAVAAAADLDDARRDFAGRLEAQAAELASHESDLAAARDELEAVRRELSDARTELADTRAAAADEARAAAAALDEARAQAAAQLTDARAAAEAEVAAARAAAESAVAGARAAAEAEVSAARAAAEAEVADLRDAHDEALGAADARVADLRAALEDARSSAESERAGHEEASAAAEAQLTSVRSSLADAQAALDEERAARAAAGAAAETARGEAAAASADLQAERVARGSLEAELDRERAARSALSDALDAETAALAHLHAELNTVRADLEAAADPQQLVALQEELARERAARQADQSALAALRDDLAAERAALADVREQLEALREEMEAARQAGRDELAAELRAEMEADRAALAALRADLDAERSAREADQRELAELRARLGTEGSLLDRVAELDRRAAGLADELELQRRAREQAEAAAAAARAPVEESGRVVADLDAAASALRERTPNGAAEAPVAEPAEGLAPRQDDAVAEPADADVAPRDDAVADLLEGAVVEEEAADEAIAPAAAPPDKQRREIVSAPSGPARAHATGRSQRQYPWLRGALVKLAHDDPPAAGRLIAGLLPVQAVIVQGPVDYDLTIQEVGTFAVTVASGRAYVKEIAEPRPRREAEFHLTAEALTLAELIAGVPHKVGRFRGPIRITGRKRRHRQLRAIQKSTLSFAEAARAGARLEPGLVFRTFPYVIHAAWSRGNRFTVAQTVDEATWYVVVGGDGEGVRVTTTPPEEPVEATVQMTAEGFGHLLRGEPAPRGQRPVVRGDREAVAMLKTWIDRAQGA